MTDIPIDPVGPPMACDRCGTRLNNWEQWKDGKLVKLSWEHTALIPEKYLNPDGSVNHRPEPILLDINENPRVGYCDFCNAEDPVWSFPTQAFQMDIHHTLGWGSADNWAACDACHDDIETNNWEPLYKRFFSHKSVPKQYRSIMRKEAEGLHRQFRLHRLGPPFRVR